jgi:general secretion pathway protein G
LVLAILGVIAAMVVPNLLGTGQTAYIKTTRTSIAALESAAMQYATTHDQEWPQNLDQLLQPETIGTQVNKPILSKVPLDAWGVPLQYQYSPGEDRPLITSFGPNKQQGGGDDITNRDDELNQNQNL